MRLEPGPPWPQLYMKGALVGGRDIVAKMALSGELEGRPNEKRVEHKPVAARSGIARRSQARGGALRHRAQV